MPEIIYVEMICHLSKQPQIENDLSDSYEVMSLKDTSEEELYLCYYSAFEKGDAQFFFEQSETERRQYFDTLSLDVARNEPGSSVILKNGDIIGFTYILPLGQGNCHISCMCVHPNHQHQGIGKFMLSYAMNEVAARGNETITLNTDVNMAAFQLYRQYGFEITEE